MYLIYLYSDYTYLGQSIRINKAKWSPRVGTELICLVAFKGHQQRALSLSCWATGGPGRGWGPVVQETSLVRSSSEKILLFQPLVCYFVREVWADANKYAHVSIEIEKATWDYVKVNTLRWLRGSVFSPPPVFVIFFINVLQSLGNIIEMREDNIFVPYSLYILF